MNSDAGVVSVLGQEVTGRGCASSVSTFCGSVTTSFMAASTCACTLTPGSGRMILETVESSLRSVLTASNCCGEEPWSSICSVSENSMVLKLGNSPSSGRLCMQATSIAMLL